MIDHYRYPGEELHLFEEVKIWKAYFSKKLHPYIHGNILEVGAGIGETTSYLLNDRVKSCVCLEPDITLFRVLQKKHQNGELPDSCLVKHGSLVDISTSSLFDVIIYIDVLEHIEKDKAELGRATLHLKQGGYLIILSPAYQFLYSSFDKAIGHYRRYTKKTLRKASDTPNLFECRMLYLDSSSVFLLLLNKFIFKKKYPTKNDIRIWQTLFVPISRLLDKLLFYRFGKSIIGIWQKK
jgi:hypothetical protein